MLYLKKEPQFGSFLLRYSVTHFTELKNTIKYKDQFKQSKFVECVYNLEAYLLLIIKLV